MMNTQLKIGIDVVDVNEFEQKIKLRGKLFLNKVFTTDELADAKNDVISLAGKFAAKEAFVKTLNNKFYLKDIMVIKKANKPVIKYQGKIYNSLSISHTKNVAVAVVINNQ